MSMNATQRPGAESGILAQFLARSMPGLPKYAQLRDTLLAAIEHGYWKAGAKLPTEQALARHTPFSLGTVQRALRALVAEGIVVRLQGSGTYVADGRNGMKVIQLTSPSSQPGFYGFSPRPSPELIAWARTPSPALAVAKGLDRDRAVDETGGQIAVFGRLGSRPVTRPGMARLFLPRGGVPWKVSDSSGTPADFTTQPSTAMLPVRIARPPSAV